MCSFCSFLGKDKESLWFTNDVSDFKRGCKEEETYLFPLLKLSLSSSLFLCNKNTHLCSYLNKSIKLFTLMFIDEQVILVYNLDRVHCR